MSEPNTINDTTIDKTKREIFVLRKEGYAVSIPYNRVDALKQIAGEHTTLSEEHADLTAKLKLAVEALEQIRDSDVHTAIEWVANNALKQIGEQR